MCDTKLYNTIFYQFSVETIYNHFFNSLRRLDGNVIFTCTQRYDDDVSCADFLPRQNGSGGSCYWNRPTTDEISGKIS